MNLPTGIVTFLFTDIQGSTSLWENNPQGMRTALERHNSILSAAITEHGGQVFKFIGDAFQTAFDAPLQAVCAALQAQRGLCTETWGEIGPLCVRMGIHAGPAEVVGSEYAVGHTLNRVARIMSAGHGGQILISGPAAELVKESLPPDIQLKDLGEHYLKGLSRPEQIFQVLVQDLPQDFPPLVTLTQPKHNLPAQLTSFIGREKEMNVIQRKFSQARLVTLTGTGGVGKTRLAEQFALKVADLYPGGVWWVELAPINKAELIPQTIGHALGMRVNGSQLPVDNLVDYLHTKKLMLVLDNCEHLVEACAQLAEELLKACPDLHLLATSREALGIEGEIVVRVPSLSTPNLDLIGIKTSQSAPDILIQYEAVQLFLERVQASLPEFQLNEATAPAVALICQRLDGIPLAIELAAARVKILNVQEIADRLENVFRLLTGGSRTAIPRHQTLRAAIAWSYDLLDNAERLLFHRLSVFVGGFTLEAAETICAGKGPASLGNVLLQPADILDLLLRLVNKSLVIVDYQTDKPSRYHLLETIRQYAREMLLESGEVEALHKRHREWFVTWVTAGLPKQMNRDLINWIDQLDNEIDNLRAALEWSFLDGSGQEYALRIGSALYRYWWMRGSLIEGYEWLKQGLTFESDRADLALARARAFYTASWIAESLSELDNSLALIRAGVDLYRKIGPEGEPGLVEALGQLAFILVQCNQLEEARKFFEEGEALGRRLGKSGIWGLAMLLWTKGLFASNQDEMEKAQSSSEESWSLFLKTGDRWNAGPLLTLGSIAQRQKRFDVAQKYFEDALTFFGEIKDRGGMGPAFVNLTFLALAQGNRRQAAIYFREAGKIWLVQGNRLQIADFIKAGVFFPTMDLMKFPADQVVMDVPADQVVEIFRIAIRAWGCAETVRPDFNDPLSEETFIKWYIGFAQQVVEFSAKPLTTEEIDLIQHHLSGLFSKLGEGGFDEAIIEGKALSLEQAISKVLDILVE